MKVKCIASSGKSLSKKQIDLGNSIEYDRIYLKINNIYTVYGIILIKDTLNYLIVIGNSDTPSFEPAEFFEIVDNKMPPTWYFNYLSETKAKWGYKELALDDDYAGGLEESENVEIFKIFYKRKKEIDDWAESKN